MFIRKKKKLVGKRKRLVEKVNNCRKKKMCVKKRK